MPDPITIGAAIAAGGQLLGTAGSGISTGRQNRKSRKWSEKMYERQKADNIAFWNMQNEYNSPEQQMQRLKDGGLNPNLVYGGSSGQTAGQAGAISTADAKTPQFQTTDFSGVANAGSTLVINIYDTRLKQATTNNLKEDNTVKRQEALLKGAQVARTLEETTGKKISNKYAGQLAEISVQANRQSIRKQEADIEATITDTQRKNALHTPNMDMLAAKLARERYGLTMDSRKLQGIIRDNQMKQFEIELQKDGIYRNDPLWLRLVIKKIDSFMESKPKNIKEIRAEALPLREQLA